MRRVKLEIVGPIVTLICGIVTIVGVYLPWVVVPLYDGYTLQISGWSMVIWSDSLGESFTEPYLLLFGGIIMLTCSLAALVVSAVSEKLQAMMRTLGIGNSIGGALSLIGAVWFLTHIAGNTSGGSVGFGFYICAVAVIIGLAFGILISLRAHKAAQVAGVTKVVTKAAWPLAVVACGVVTLAGVFMPWMSASAGGITDTTCGWDLTRFNLIGASNPEPFLVMAGGISMIVCGVLLVVGASLAITYAIPYAETRKLFYTMGVLAYLSSALAIGGALWFAIPAVGDIGTGSIGYGIYISVVAAVAGALIGVRTSIQILRSLQTVCVEGSGCMQGCTREGD